MLVPRSATRPRRCRRTTRTTDQAKSATTIKSTTFATLAASRDIGRSDGGSPAGERARASLPRRRHVRAHLTGDAASRQGPEPVAVAGAAVPYDAPSDIGG